MPKEPSSNQVNESQGKILKNGNIECILCGKVYKPAGFHNHKNSKVCAVNHRWKPEIDAIALRRSELVKQGKVPITKTVANALQRRGLEKITGLEFDNTDYRLDFGVEEGSSKELVVLNNAWVYDWVCRGYGYYARNFTVSPNPMYEELLQIKTAEDPEAALNMTMLKWLDI